MPSSGFEVWPAETHVTADHIPSDMQPVTQADHPTYPSPLAADDSSNDMLVDSTSILTAIADPGAEAHRPLAKPILSPAAVRRRRAAHPATDILKEWLRVHSVHPYPSEDEKRDLCARTKLTMTQVSNWMICARRHKEAHAPKRVVTKDENRAALRVGRYHSALRDDGNINGSSHFVTPPASPPPLVYRASL